METLHLIAGQVFCLKYGVVHPDDVECEGQHRDAYVDLAPDDILPEGR